MEDEIPGEAQNAAPLEGDISQALAKEGFKEHLIGEHTPPVTRYTLGEDEAGFYAEFLTPLIGSGRKRDGKPDATLLKAGITAQKLRYLEILLASPWQVRLSAGNGVPLNRPTDLQIANPTSFIVQKLLIHEYRKPAKRAQDVLYIHDTLELFADNLPALASLWKDTLQPSLGEKTSKRVVHLSQEHLSSVTDVIREAARIPQDRSLDPALVQRSCAASLERVLKE